jgi:hypothetical protein
MSQKSSVIQIASWVSWVLTPDKRIKRRTIQQRRLMHHQKAA